MSRLMESQFSGCAPARADARKEMEACSSHAFTEQDQKRFA
jgi:hypothetical protein